VKKKKKKIHRTGPVSAQAAQYRGKGARARGRAGDFAQGSPGFWLTKNEFLLLFLVSLTDCR
jgi:hypothetical protein